ncbi:MAG: heme-binding protein, partial [Pseudomonadota bacterium]
MSRLTLEQAKTIVDETLAEGAKQGFKPLTVAVVDPSGDLIALHRSDGASPLRPKVAHGKANACVQVGLGGRALYARAEQQAYFVLSLNAMCDGLFVPVPGGLLVRDGAGAVIGGVGVTGDTSDNDEICALAGVAAAGLTADT